MAARCSGNLSIATARDCPWLSNTAHLHYLQLELRHISAIFVQDTAKGQAPRPHHPIVGAIPGASAEDFAMMSLRCIRPGRCTAPPKRCVPWFRHPRLVKTALREPHHRRMREKSKPRNGKAACSMVTTLYATDLCLKSMVCRE